MQFKTQNLMFPSIHRQNYPSFDVNDKNNRLFREKERIIQTSDGKRFQSYSLRFSKDNDSSYRYDPQDDNFDLLNEFSDIHNMAKTVLSRNGFTKEKVNSNEDKKLILESPFQRPSKTPIINFEIPSIKKKSDCSPDLKYHSLKIDEEVEESSYEKFDAIYECSNEQESWKPDPCTNYKFNTNHNEKGIIRKHNKRLFTKAKSPTFIKKEEEKQFKKKCKFDRTKIKSFHRKRKINSKISLNKSSLSSQGSFIKTPDQKLTQDKIKLCITNKQLEVNPKIPSKSKMHKHQNLINKEGYSTMRIDKNNQNIEHNTSVRPPTYKKSLI